MGYPTLRLDRDELACINELFEQGDDFTLVTDKLPLVGAMPSRLLEIFQKGKFSLLGELDDYQLLFPLTFNLTAEGTVKPTIGSPEVLETAGTERSWRLKNIKDVQVHIEDLDLDTISSLSSTGMALSLPEGDAYPLMNSLLTLQVCLPDHPGPIELMGTAIRYENGELALRFDEPPRIIEESLKEFLFAQHQDKHKELYQQLHEEELCDDL